MWRRAEIWPVEHKPFRHSTMRSGSSSSSSRFKIRPKQVNASTCDFDRCCLQSGDNTGTHLHVSRKAKAADTACVTRFSTLDEAVKLACDTEYGLALGIFTADVATGLALAERIPTGTAHINDQTLRDDAQ